MDCQYCNKEIESKWGKKFCSISCSAKHKNANNHSTLGRAQRHLCTTPECTNFRRSVAHLRCPQCDQARKIYAQNPTKGELSKAYKRNNLASSAFAYIRFHARHIVMASTPSKCQCCGYDKHTEVCHIKSIASFSEDAKLLEINDHSNLLRLCPNCHWEYDHNLLKFGTDGGTRTHIDSNYGTSA